MRAPRSVRAVSEISTPGAIAPPRYSPSSETASKLIPVPKSTTTQRVAEALVGGDRVDEPVGADLVGVVDPDRHPGLDPGPDQRGRAPRGSGAAIASYSVPSGGTTDETTRASTSRSRSPLSARSPLIRSASSSPVAPGARLETPVLDQLGRRRRRRGGSACCRRRPRGASGRLSDGTRAGCMSAI